VTPNKLPFPEGIVAFTKMFPDEKACEDYLFQVRWPLGFRCPKCGSTKGYEYDNKRVTQCENHHIVSLTSGTSMHKSKQDLLTWFWAAYFVTTHTPGISAVQFQKHLQIPRYETAFQLLHKVRSALVAPNRDKLKGRVELDETFITRKDGEVTTVLVAIEVVTYPGLVKGEPATLERAGRVRMRKVPDKSHASILPFVADNVETGSNVYTDGSVSYDALNRMGYTVHPWVQGKGKNAVYTNKHLHRMISNFKTWLRGTHHDAVSGKHLQAYLNEFTYRHNRRDNPWVAFNRALGLASHAEKWPEYETLYDVGEDGGWTHPNPKPEDESDVDVVEVIFEELLKEAPPELRVWMAQKRNEVEASIRSAVNQSRAA
jgi:transposase-like protein